MTTTDQVVWTTLPNGLSSARKARISILATVRLSGSDSDKLYNHQVFQNWPKALKAVTSRKWTVAYSGGMSKTYPFDDSLLDEDMWAALFRTNLDVRSREGSSAYQSADVSSYDAGILNKSQKQHRAALAINYLPSVRSKDGFVSQPWQQVLSNRFSSANLYLQPGPGGPSSTQIASDEGAIAHYRAQIYSHARARDFVESAPNNISRNRKSILEARLKRDLMRLERSGTSPVKAAALLALVDLHADQLESADAANLKTAIANELRESAYVTAGIGQRQLDAIKPQLRFGLFHLRPDMASRPEQATVLYDFHKVLTMVGQFPSLLYPLGLAFDIEADAPPEGDGTVKVSLDSFDEAKAVSLETQYVCSSDAFEAKPKDASLLKGRMLNLVPENGFELIIEDVDGANLKDMMHAEADERAKEYKAFDSPQDSDRWPSNRSAGISLLCDQREKLVKEAIKADGKAQLLANAVASNANAPAAIPVLTAEDTTLGYRIDIWDNYSGKWHSLSERQGQYYFFDSDKGHLNPWISPAPLRNREAGFIQLAATTPADAKEGDQKQVQVHHAVFSWNGWSLSVPHPARPINPSVDSKKDDKPLRMRPKFVVGRGTLPPLRVGVAYKVRCRAVDLVGNSLAASEKDIYHPTIGDSSAAGRDGSLVYKRWEPCRAPSILLLNAIQPVELPGEQMDLLALRDGHGDSIRFLVPPRVPQEFAEIHSKFDRDGLLPGAFPHIELTKDGSFPSFSEDSRKSLAERNAYFHYDRHINQAPNCPYFPDPLVEQVRIKGWYLNDRWTRVNEQADWDLTIPFYQEDNPWPNCWAVRIRLKSGDGHIWEIGHQHKAPAWHWELLDGSPGSPLEPALDIPLLFGERAELEISSVLSQQAQTGPDKSVPVEDCLALIQETESFLTENYSLGLNRNELDEFSNGSHRLVSPTHTLVLVHAVKKPPSPKFAPNFLIQRTLPNDPDAQVGGDIEIDWNTSARLVCNGHWKDWVDDLQKPGPELVETSEVAFEIKATDADRLPSNQKQSFRDTRFHLVEYELSASSRFREFYKKDSHESEFQSKGQLSSKIKVNSSERPHVPSVAYIIPAFAWNGDKDFDKDKKIKTRARTGALRVYLYRPWFTSGNDERLGVVYPKGDSAGDTRLLDFVSQWGVDPIWKSGVLPQLLDMKHFCGYQDHSEDCLLAEFPEDKKRAVNVVGYETHYDTDRRLWFADIEINPESSYFPFVRLALVRYQPNSIFDTQATPPADARISQVVISDFAQLAPNRWAHVQKLNNKTLQLCVSGVSYDLCMEGEKGPSIVQVSVQERWHRAGRDLGWVTTKKMRDFKITTTAGITTWEKTISLDHSTFWYKYRLLIEEYEQIYADGDGTNDRDPLKKHIKERLVYADVFEL